MSAAVEEFLDEATLVQHERTRVGMLNKLSQSLKRFDSRSERAAFAKLFRDAQDILELEDDALAAMLRVSRPTIGRWARGESAPHPLGREPVFRVLAKVADSKLKLHSHVQGNSLRLGV